MKTTTLTKKQKYRVFAIMLIMFLVGIFSTIIYTMIDDWETSSKIPLAEHYNLFAEEAQSKLSLLATTKSRNRETTSSYIYDKRFNLFVLKMILVNDYGLKEIINFKNESSYITMNAVYSGLSNYNMDMNIKSGKSVLVSTVNFKQSGGPIKLIQESDRFYCYYYKFKTFSINYNDEPYDIIAEANDTALPTSLAFIKKGKFLYIIIMNVAKGKEAMEPKQLYDIIDMKYKDQT